jgi:hypothetical protein
LDRRGGDRGWRRRRLTPLADDGGIEIVGALRFAACLDAHAVAKKEDGFGLGFASGVSRFLAARCGVTGLLRHRDARQGEARGSHGREHYPVG